jgi:hypothetical protein
MYQYIMRKLAQFFNFHQSNTGSQYYTATPLAFQYVKLSYLARFSSQNNLIDRCACVENNVEKFLDLDISKII